MVLIATLKEAIEQEKRFEEHSDSESAQVAADERLLRRKYPVNYSKAVDQLQSDFNPLLEGQ